MAAFPQTASGLKDLAAAMINGFDQHAQLFPGVTLAIQTALDQSLSGYQAAIAGQESAKAAAKAATVAKDSAEGALADQMIKVLKLAENDSMANPENLDYIGWSPRKQPTPLAAPGQPNELEAFKEGPGIITLKWMKSLYGGMPSSYKIQRADQLSGGMPGPWMLVATSYDINITLREQPRMTELQYRVIASNPAGDSMPSNIATAVL